MIDFFKRHNISLQLLLLIAALWSFSFYNYVSQKALFLTQLQSNSSDLLQSVRASILKFDSIEDTLSLQALVRRISFKLEIFEFRYLDQNGVVVSSMFEEEVGQLHDRPGIKLALEALAAPGQFPAGGRFYMEERDLTNVLASSFPVREGERLFGIIDLAVDVTEFDYLSEASRAAVLRRLQVDITNLLNAVAGSLISRAKVFETLNMHDFLAALVAQTGGVLEVSLAEATGRIYGSSRSLPAQGAWLGSGPVSGAIQRRDDGVYEYRLQVPLYPEGDDGRVMSLAIDASGYAANERKLFYTSLATSLLAILVAVTIVYTIYRINLRRGREENLRLERMVKERTDELRRISQTDKLTGLANRSHLEEQLDIEFKRAGRYQLPLSLALLDLDLFKRVNDNYGHLAGDAVLREIGARLRAELRETDFVGRFGGEEFVVILTNTNLSDALMLAEILRRLVEETPVHFEGQDLPVTASIGVAQMQPSHGDHKAIFAAADQALYLAKDSGRNRVAYMRDGEVRNFVDKPLSGG
ncbi:MAG: GGDEF domain-containing protein [Gammaproteobacteria bacterium]|nr:GGDEF domain-containing protein [Gammaproteobacteria bacterium]